MRKLIFLAFSGITWFLMKDNHKCDREHCPYKDVPPIDWTTFLEQSNTRQSDSIHLLNPEMDYRQVDSTLKTLK